MSVHEITEAIDMRLLAAIASAREPITVEVAAERARLTVEATMNGVERLAGRVRAFRPTVPNGLGPVVLKAA